MPGASEDVLTQISGVRIKKRCEGIDAASGTMCLRCKERKQKNPNWTCTFGGTILPNEYPPGNWWAVQQANQPAPYPLICQRCWALNATCTWGGRPTVQTHWGRPCQQCVDVGADCFSLNGVRIMQPFVAAHSGPAPAPGPAAGGRVGSRSPGTRGGRKRRIEEVDDNEEEEEEEEDEVDEADGDAADEEEPGDEGGRAGSKREARMGMKRLFALAEATHTAAKHCVMCRENHHNYCSAVLHNGGDPNQNIGCSHCASFGLLCVKRPSASDNGQRVIMPTDQNMAGVGRVRLSLRFSSCSRCRTNGLACDR